MARRPIAIVKVSPDATDDELRAAAEQLVDAIASEITATPTPTA